MNNVAKHTIRIMNYNLTLTSDDDKSYIESVAERVERNIKTLSDNMPTRNMTEVALFVAMDYCDRYMKAIGDGTTMRGQIKDYLKDTGEARRRLEEAEKENEQLKAEVEKLRARLSGASEAPFAALEVQPEEPAANVNEEKPVKAEEPVKSTLSERETLFGRKKNAKGKKKEGKAPSAPVKGAWGADAFSESADAAADIMSFFESKAFDDE